MILLTNKNTVGYSRVGYIQESTAIALSLEGPFVATVLLEGSVNGIDYSSLDVVSDLTAAGSMTAPGIYQAFVQGYNFIRVNVSAHTSGNISASFESSNNPVKLGGTKGDQGTKGDKGDQGDVGPSGNVPAGGTTGQVATKQSNADFDIGWADSDINTLRSDMNTIVGNAGDFVSGITAGNWTGSPPTNIVDAINRIAAAIGPVA